jgi:hypothetical protein
MALAPGVSMRTGRIRQFITKTRNMAVPCEAARPDLWKEYDA